MFSRITIITIFTSALLAVATPAPLEARNDAPSSCDTGPIQCCQSTETVNITLTSSFMRYIKANVHLV